MLKGGLVLIWELDMNLGPTLVDKNPTRGGLRLASFVHV